jgi:hypothetical protein
MFEIGIFVRHPALLKLSAIWNVAITHRSICLPDLPAVSHVRRY